MKRTLLFTAIVSVLTTSAFASNIVTSQTYVDNQDALKVNIAQGVGTNNANVGKTLVVNSSGNLELGTPAAGNYVEDSITDGVTNKAPSENAVHDALEDKQDTIGADMMEYNTNGYLSTISFPTVVSYDSTNGVSGTQYGILDVFSHDELFDDGDSLIWPEDPDKWLVSMDGSYAIANDLAKEKFSSRLPPSDYTSVADNEMIGVVSVGYPAYWLDSRVQGVSLVTRTTNDGFTGERKIFEASDVANYNSGTADEKQVKSISIPTMGAVMAAITAATPTGTPNTIANYDSNGVLAGGIATYDGSGTYNSSTDSGKIATAAAVNTRQAKKTCAGWLDGTTVADATHTDANCVLWNLPD